MNKEQEQTALLEEAAKCLLEVCNKTECDECDFNDEYSACPMKLAGYIMRLKERMK